MKILVFSDSHGSCGLMEAAVKLHMPDLTLFLGDGASDITALRASYPELSVRCVRGNCDPAGFAPEKLIIEESGKKIMMTHGHAYGVKLGLQRVFYAALEAQADIILFGHTHEAYRAEREGLIMLNPGSVGRGRNRSYALLESDEAGNMKYQIRYAADM
ncbi:MAG: metallophosphoesterase [Clostridiales bacterium]|nr:metallophosphoesterase [Clostridiales bacterium]